MQIALVADPHTTRGTAEDQPLYRGRFANVIAAVNAAKVDVVLVAGDLTQGSKDEQAADFRELAAGFAAPVYWVPGNHDSGDKITPGKDFPPVTSEKVRRYEALLGPACQSVEIAGVRVICANASIYGSGLPEEAEQWAFLEKELGRPAAIPTVLLQHYPLFVDHPHEPGGNYWVMEPEPRMRLLNLLRRGGVQAVLSGHYHRPLATWYDGMAFITAPAVSFGLPRETQGTGWVRVTITPYPSGEGVPESGQGARATVTAHYRTVPTEVAR